MEQSHPLIRLPYGWCGEQGKAGGLLLTVTIHRPWQQCTRHHKETVKHQLELSHTDPPVRSVTKHCTLCHVLQGADAAATGSAGVPACPQHSDVRQHPTTLSCSGTVQMSRFCFDSVDNFLTGAVCSSSAGSCNWHRGREQPESEPCMCCGGWSELLTYTSMTPGGGKGGSCKKQSLCWEKHAAAASYISRASVRFRLWISEYTLVRNGY